MPFTLSHPAIVLPLLFRTRRWLSITGLVLGSMAPDFEYFLRLRAFGSYGHNFAGLFWFDLPLCLLGAGLFHGIVKKPLVRSLPHILRTRLGRLADHPWPIRQLWSGRMILGILVGSVSHILWDSFTHGGTFVTERVAWLRQMVGPLPLHDWLQYTCSVIGLAAIGWFFWKLPLRPRMVKASTKIQRLFWILNFVLTGAFWPLFFLLNDNDERGILLSIIVTGISAITLSQVLSSLIMQRYFRPSEQAKATRLLTHKIAHELAHKQPQS